MTEHRYYLRGEVDLATASELRAGLARAIDHDGADLLVDCAQLTFIDSTGIAVLLETNRALEASGRRMLIINVSGAARRIFEALGLTDLMYYNRGADEP